MKLFISILFSSVLLPAVNAQIHPEQALSVPYISAIDAAYPLFLQKVNFNDKNKIVQLNDGKIAMIGSTIRSFYFNECAGDSSETYFSIKDTYYNTLQLRDSQYTIYLVLLKHMPGEELTCKILFYDNVVKAFADSMFDFNIHALYDCHDGKLVPSNLKKSFKIQSPEIEIIDPDKDGINEFKISRLYHNGTSNAIETFVLKPGLNKVEKLQFSRKFL